MKVGVARPLMNSVNCCRDAYPYFVYKLPRSISYMTIKVIM